MKKKFTSIRQLQELQELACRVQEDVFIHALDNSVMVDAKSFIGLFSLDFSKEVNVTTESEWLMKKIKTKFMPDGDA
ncbi:MAG: hypothetical protein LUG13_00075 [Oscillospiraceae bacterium]|nr:hypothetical protein [Oscillospiraceae bacterium]